LAFSALSAGNLNDRYGERELILGPYLPRAVAPMGRIRFRLPFGSDFGIIRRCAEDVVVTMSYRAFRVEDAKA
jgi:hypothetical protein